MTLADEEQKLMRDVREALTLRSGLPYPPSSTQAAGVLLEYLVGKHGEEAAVAMIEERLAMGQERYGKLAETLWTGRDFGTEFDEECVDAIIYEWCEYRNGEGE